MIAASVVAALIGLAGTWIALGRLARREPPPSLILAWGLGLAGLFPAWLVGFLGLLNEMSGGGRPEGAPHILWILSSAAALLGVILTDAAVRRLEKEGTARPAASWLLGVAAFFPAWGITLGGLLWARP